MSDWADVYIFAMRAGVRKRCHSDDACEMSSHGFKSSEEVYMCASRADVSVSCCHSKGACPI